MLELWRISLDTRQIVFYPAAEEQIGEKESIDEAREEHHVVKLLIGELKQMSANDDRYDAKYTVLAESVKASSMRKTSAQKWRIGSNSSNSSLTNVRLKPKVALERGNHGKGVRLKGERDHPEDNDRPTKSGRFVVLLAKSRKAAIR